MRPLKDTRINAALFALALLGTLVGQLKGWHRLEYVCRPLLMIVLSSWFFFNSRRVGDRFTLLVQAGLFFSLVGDVVLMFEHHDAFLFLIGLAAFLLAQVCYAIAFAINVFEIGGTEGAWISGGLSVLMLAAGGLFLLEVLDDRNVDSGIQLPISLLTLAFSGMGVFAALRFRKTYDRSFWLVLGGALLLMASDVLLANAKFNLRPFDPGPAPMLLAHAAGQFMIAGGCLLHVLDPEMIRRRNALSA